MTSPLSAFRPVRSLGVFAVAACLALWPALLQAQGQRKNPASKVYFADVNGDAQIDTGDMVEDVTKRSVYTAEGTVIETKKADTAAAGQAYSTMVYSNGTGAYFDADTRVEVKQFVQEPFVPNRTDMEVEPSISQTQAFVARGTVGLCTSKLVAGSSMTYQTPQAAVNVRGRKVVIEASADVTKISMLEGESTVRTADNELGGQALKAGEQAIIRRNASGGGFAVQIRPIPPQEAPQLDDKVAMACMAKKTVYFEVRDTQVDGRDPRAKDNEAGNGGNGDGNSDGGAITAFDGNSSSSNNNSGGTVREIVPVPVVPANLPVQFTVSPSVIVTPGK